MLATLACAAGFLYFKKKCVEFTNNQQIKDVLLSRTNLVILPRVAVRLDPLAQFRENNINEVSKIIFSMNIIDPKDPQKLNRSIISLLTNKYLRKQIHDYFSYIPKEESDTLYEIYKVITSKNMLEYISTLTSSRLNGGIRDELLTYIINSPEEQPYYWSIYKFFYEKMKEITLRYRTNYSLLFLTNKNSEASEYINDFLENIGIRDFSTIFNNFNTITLMPKTSQSDSIIFSGHLNRSSAQEINSIRADKDFFQNIVVFKVYPKLKTAGIKQLEFEKNMYEQLFKLVKYNVTPNILCKVVTSDILNFQTNFVDKLASPIKQSFESRIKSANGTLSLKDDTYKWNNTGVIMTQYGGTQFNKVFTPLSNENRRKVMFQILYTLYVFEKLEISHGDIHHGNIFITEIPRRRLYYIIDGVQYMFYTTYLVKIFDFDHSIICKTNRIKYNKTSVEIQEQLNPIRSADATGADAKSKKGETDIFNKNLDKVIFFLNFDKYNKKKGLGALQFSSIKDPNFNKFYKTVFPAVDTDSVISSKTIDSSFDILEDEFKEPNRIYNVKSSDDYNIDPTIAAQTWNTYFRETVQSKNTNHIVKSNWSVPYNHLWVPDNVILPTLDMLKNEYFDVFIKTDVHFNVTESIVYTIDDRIVQ
jgi:hypothetical protein